MTIQKELKSYTDSQGNASILIRVTINRKNAYYNTGLKIRPNLWDKKKGIAKKTYLASASINRKLTTLCDKLLLLSASSKEEISDPKELIKMMVSENTSAFGKYAKIYLDQLIADDSFYSIRRTNSVLRDFYRFFNSKVVKTDDLKPTNMEGFIGFLRTKGNRNNSIRRKVSTIRAVLRLMVNDDVNNRTVLINIAPTKRVSAILKQTPKKSFLLFF